MLSNKKYAFSLAEVLVTLAVVGILSTILTGVIGMILPDKSIVMVKKAFTNLSLVTDTLVNSDDIYGGEGPYSAGNLNYVKPGEIDTTTKFCSNVCNLLDTKEICPTPDCSTFTTTDGMIWKFEPDGTSIKVTVDVIGKDEASDKYLFTVSSIGQITPDENTKAILKDIYNNRK